MCICFVEVFEHEYFVLGELLEKDEYYENKRTLLNWGFMMEWHVTGFVFMMLWLNIMNQCWLS